MSAFTNLLGPMGSQLLAIFGETVTYEQDLAGQFSVTCMIQRGDQTSDGRDATALLVDVRVDQFTGTDQHTPLEGDRIIADAKKYRITEVQRNDEFWRLSCRFVSVVI